MFPANQRRKMINHRARVFEKTLLQLFVGKKFK